MSAEEKKLPALTEAEIRSLREETDPNRLLEKVKVVLPGWIKEEPIQFSQDLARANLGWARLCDQLNVEPRHIVLVDNCLLDQRRHSQKTLLTRVVEEACNSLTRLGYHVREMKHFELCSRCREVIVAKWILDQNQVPYTGMCQPCTRKVCGVEVAIKVHETTP